MADADVEDLCRRSMQEIFDALMKAICEQQERFAKSDDRSRFTALQGAHRALSWHIGCIRRLMETSFDVPFDDLGARLERDFETYRAQGAEHADFHTLGRRF